MRWVTLPCRVVGAVVVATGGSGGLRRCAGLQIPRRPTRTELLGMTERGGPLGTGQTEHAGWALLHLVVCMPDICTALALGPKRKPEDRWSSITRTSGSSPGRRWHCGKIRARALPFVRSGGFAAIAWLQTVDSQHSGSEAIRGASPAQAIASSA